MSDSDETPPDEDRTVFRPGAPASVPPATPASAPPSPPPPSPPQGTAMPAGTFTPMAPRTGGAGIQIGDVLNHIFEVKRFIARGGMGEVFEGVNVNSDEPVAIKVILPAMAADPNVQAMFRKEARTLTRLSHPALVQYRVLAQEPQLGVLYIVTEFIEGRNLSDVLGELSPGVADLRGLTRRLAEGLRAAHALGAIHRDMSPDNVLLEHGRLDRARIIDFGIAKDLDPGQKTIIGDGFAGKLGYVAPEQLGDFDREVGPWSDVYSLGLVILAVALGRNVDMGTTFVGAIDKRRTGADLSDAPAELRPILEQMLRADPARRLRSMDEVLAALDAPAAPVAVAQPPAAPEGAARAAAAPARRPAPAPAANDRFERKPASGSRLPLFGGLAAGLVALLAGGAFLAFGGGDDAAPVAAPKSAAVVATAGSPADKARAAVAAALPTIACTWLDLANVAEGGDGVTLALTGVAGKPGEAQAAVARAAADAGVPVAATDFADVAPISGSECGAIDAFRLIRATGRQHLTVTQRKFEMAPLGPETAYPGQNGARAVINLAMGDPKQDFALYGIEPNGEISKIAGNRAEFASFVTGGGPIADLGGDTYRIQVDINHSGWSGVLLLTGKGGFPSKLFEAGAGSRTAEWQRNFATVAATNDWQTEMVWFKMVDEVPNG
ncbi:serine/threonine-protein kinase [Sphingomonas profundi]|uniref:serine/threonine-protein kinase n=1 Tax=Alterirhizorhabdus profundi TaxID=2681549 RepID=UPI0012E932ED|nr:serine/threonine-protein kinase [Sphingomonas profundi]